MKEAQGARRGLRPLPQPQSAQLPFMGRLLVSADLTSDRTSATGGCPRFALPGRAALPGPRHRRILRNLLIKQFSAVAARTQRTVSGQASFAGQAVRKAHSESQADRPENECIHFPAGFLAFFARKLAWRLSSFRRSLFVRLFSRHRRNGSRAQAGPGAGFQGLHRPLTFFPS